MITSTNGTLQNTLIRSLFLVLTLLTVTAFTSPVPVSGMMLLGAFNQQTCIVQGYVRDKITRNPAQGATVYFTQSNQQAITDPNGHFQILDSYPSVKKITATGNGIYCAGVTIDTNGKGTVNVVLETKPDGTLKVKVIDAKKEPFPKAYISFQYENSDKETNYKQYVSDQKGECTISKLDPDGTIKMINAYSNNYRASGKQNLRFPAGQREFNITLEMVSTNIDTTDRHDRISISGDVVDSSNNPIVKANINTGTYFYQDPRSGSTTDSKGHFEIKNIYYNEANLGYMGALILYARSTGYAPAWKKIQSSKDTVFRIVMTAAHHISGKVVDIDGEPLPRVNINVNALLPADLAPEGVYYNNNSPETVQSDSTGLFKINNLPENRVKFSFHLDGYTPIMDTTLSIDQDDMVITLLNSGVIEGTVIDDKTEKPVTAYKIYLSGSGMGQSYFPYEYMQKGVWCYPDDGKFSVAKLALNAHISVSIQAEGYRKETIPIVIVRESPLKEADKLIFRMKKSNPLSGIVTDNNLGTGIPNATVKVLLPKNDFGGNYPFTYFSWNYGADYGQWNIQSETTTNSKGYFFFSNTLSASSGYLIVEKPGYGRLETGPVDFQQYLPIKLSKAASITCLTKAQGIISKDTITASLSRYDQKMSIVYEPNYPNDDGKIIYTNLPVGNFRIDVRRNTTSNSHQVFLVEGQNYVIDLTNRPTIKVFGKITWKGAPQQQVSINTFCEDSPLAQNASSPDKDGKYEIWLSTPGKYQFSFYKFQNNQAFPIHITRSLSVSSGDYRLDCNLPDAVIQGIVVNPKIGKPVPHVLVSAYQKKDDASMMRYAAAVHSEYTCSTWNLFKTMTTDDNGRFGMENLESGDWTLVEEKEPGLVVSVKAVKLKINETKDNVVLMEKETGSLDIAVYDMDSGNRVIPREVGCTDSTGFVFNPLMTKKITPNFVPFYFPQIATDSTGIVHYKSLPAGTYQVYAGTDIHLTGSTEIVITAGQSTTASLKLQKAGRLLITFPETTVLKEKEQVYCVCKVQRAKDAKPVMQDAAGFYKKRSFVFSSQSTVSTIAIPLPPENYTVELQSLYFSPQRSNSRLTPVTRTKIMKIEQGQDTPWVLDLKSLK